MAELAAPQMVVNSRMLYTSWMPADPEAAQAWRTVWLPWFAGAACALATIVIFIAPQWLWDSVR